MPMVYNNSTIVLMEPVQCACAKVRYSGILEFPGTGIPKMTLSLVGPTLTKYHQWGLQRHQDFFLFQMKTLFLAIATLTVSLVNMNCIWPPIRTLTKTKSITAPPTSSLSLSPGEYLREGMCQYTCKESGGCNTQLVVDWAKVTEKW